MLQNYNKSEVLYQESDNMIYWLSSFKCARATVFWLAADRIIHTSSDQRRYFVPSYVLCTARATRAADKSVRPTSFQSSQLVAQLVNDRGTDLAARVQYMSRIPAYFLMARSIGQNNLQPLSAEPPKRRGPQCTNSVDLCLWPCGTSPICHYDSHVCIPRVFSAQWLIGFEVSFIGLSPSAFLKVAPISNYLPSLSNTAK